MTKYNTRYSRVIDTFQIYVCSLVENKPGKDINMPSFVSIGIICYPSYHSTFSLLLYVGVASVLGRSCHDVGCPLHLLPPRLASDWVRQLGGHPLCPHTCPSTANPAWLCAGIYWAVGGWVGASFYSYPFFLTRSHFDRLH